MFYNYNHGEGPYKGPTSAFSWSKAPTFKSLLRHYAKPKRALSHGNVSRDEIVKLQS